MNNRYRTPMGLAWFVSSGLGGNTFGTFERKHTGALKRVKSPTMPMVSSFEEAQRNLDAWAAKHGLEKHE